jgi:hypothetical protein
MNAREDSSFTAAESGVANEPARPCSPAADSLEPLD